MSRNHLGRYQESPLDTHHTLVFREYRFQVNILIECRQESLYGSVMRYVYQFLVFNSSQQALLICRKCHAEMRPLMVCFIAVTPSAPHLSNKQVPDPVCASCHGSFVEKVSL